MFKWRCLVFVCSGILYFFTTQCHAQTSNKVPTSKRSIEAVKRVKPDLEKKLILENFQWGSPVFIRVFKQSKMLEIWLETKGQYRLFQAYPICYFSGQLGPKNKEGDLQVPEGFYSVSAKTMNPWSQFHLSFNIGYPNSFDLSKQRTGSYIMVHGSCVSTGCLAMTDEKIEEIYALVEAAINAGQQKVPIHIFPFSMTKTNMAKYTKHKDISFWKNLQQGYHYFETNLKPPKVSHKAGNYTFQ